MKYKDPITGEYKELFLKASDTLPIGTIVPYGSDDIPANWLLCDGRAVSRTTYANLFSVIGTNFGEGDGTTTFNLPDLKGRVPVGLDSEDTDFDALGKTGGEKEHILTISEMPSHTHSYNFSTSSSDWTSRIPLGSNAGVGTTGSSISPTGGDEAHNNMQPYQIVNYIIKSAMSVGVIGSVLNNKSDSSKDTYSCNYINNAIKEVYSEEETVVGTWMGKPLYRKVIARNKSITNGTSITVSSLNIDELIKIDSINQKQSSNFKFFGSYYDSSNEKINIHLNSNEIQVWSATGAKYISTIWIEYTKTTDSEITN